MFKILALLFFYFLCGIPQLSAQIMADSIPFKIQLLNNQNVTALRSEKNVTFEDVKDLTNWKPYDSSYIASKVESIWLKFKIKNRSQDSVKVYLHSLTDYTHIYQQVYSDYKIFKNGFYIPLIERTNNIERIFTKLRFTPFQESEIYVRLDIHTDPILTKPHMYSERAYWEVS